MTSFWDHLYQYAQEHLVVRYLQEEPTGYGRLSIQTDARRRGLEDLLRGPAARSFRRLWEEQQELHSLEEQALFRAGREEFDRAAAELLAGNGPAELPRGVTEVTLYPAGEGRVQTVEFLCGGWGVGLSTSYWGISHVPSDVLTGFQGAALSGWEPWDGGWLWREAGGDNRCFVRRLEPGWFCFEMRF